MKQNVLAFPPPFEMVPQKDDVLKEHRRNILMMFIRNEFQSPGEDPIGEDPIVSHG